MHSPVVFPSSGGKGGLPSKEEQLLGWIGGGFRRETCSKQGGTSQPEL